MCRLCDQDVLGAEVGSICRGMKESWFPPTWALGREMDCNRGRIVVEDLEGESSTKHESQHEH
jgi:hypothetical protein